MKKINRKEFLEISIKAAGTLLAGSALGSKISLAGTKRTTLHAGYLPIADHLILPVSHARDNSNYQNLRVKPHRCRSWDEIAIKFDTGMLQAAFMLAPHAMYNSNRDPSLRCILAGHTDGSVIASRKDIINAKGLIGCTVGVPHKRSTHSVLLYKYLKEKNIDMKKSVRLQKVDPPLIVKSLKSGRIDAYAVAEPWGLKGVDKGIARVMELSKNIIPGHICCIIIMKKRYIEKNKDAVEEWVRSLNEAGRFIHNNIKDAASIQKPYMNHNPEEIEKTISGGLISYRDLRPDRKKFVEMHDMAMKSGVLPEKCNLDRLLDNSFAGRA